jgi:hypothetical protein
MPVIGETKLHVDGNHEATWNGKSWEVRAVDPVSVRQTRNIAEKALAEDRASYARGVALQPQLERFSQLNMKTRTGSLGDQIPGINSALANMFGGDAKSELASISAALQVNGVPQGQGSVANFERVLFGDVQAGISKPGPVNTKIISNQLTAIQKEGKRLAFYENWLARNGNLNGAAAAWDAQGRPSKLQRRSAYSVPGAEAMIGNAKTAVAARKAPSAQRLTPEQAARLAPGTRFIGTDGKERVRN